MNQGKNCWLLALVHVATIKCRPEPIGLCSVGHRGGGGLCCTSPVQRWPEGSRGGRHDARLHRQELCGLPASFGGHAEGKWRLLQALIYYIRQRLMFDACHWKSQWVLDAFRHDARMLRFFGVSPVFRQNPKIWRSRWFIWVYRLAEMVCLVVFYPQICKMLTCVEGWGLCPPIILTPQFIWGTCCFNRCP